MKFLYGFVGAIFGCILGGVTALFIATIVMDGDDLGVGFAMIFAGPIGLVIGTILGIVIALLLFRYVKRNLHDDQPKHKRTLLGGAFVLVVAILVSAMLWDVKHYATLPPDQQLLRNFDQNRSTFDELAKMTQADKNLARVDYDWTQPSDPQTIGVSSERIARYRQLLDEINLHRGFESTVVESSSC